MKVESSDVDMGTVVIGGASSSLKIDNDDASTPLLVVVDGLSTLSYKAEMTVSRPESSVALRNKAKDDGRTLGLIFNFDIKNLDANEPVTDTGSNLLHIYIELPEEMQNKTDFVVYRQHKDSSGSDGTGMRVDTLTTTKNDDDEYVEISGKYLIIHARYFSDYAFAYPVYSSSSDDNSEIFYTIEAYANENGTISPKGNVKVKYERDKTFEITADEGYEIEKVLVDGDDVGAVDTYTFENVRRRHTIEAFFKEAEEIVEIEEEENKFLPDGLNYEDHIAYVSGYEDEFVRPEKAVTRAEAAMMLYRLLTEECLDKIGTKIHYFTDVNADDWYCEAVATMANGGYISGYKDGTFGGDKLITRAEFVAILVRFVGEMDVECDFTDLDESHWAYRAIATAVEAGWIAGFEDGSFHPEKPITRAEVMAVINRALNRGVDEDSELLDYKIWPDNFPGKWYYYEVVEATNSHDYVGERPSENWIEVK